MRRLNLYEDFPELRDQWVGDIELMKLQKASSKDKVYWKCKSGNPCHVWIASIRDRAVRKSGCLFCCKQQTCSCENCPNLYNNFPELRDEWNNIESMKEYSIGSNTKVSWKCKSGCPCHVWIASIQNRTTGSGCPYCSGHRICACDSCPNLYNDYPDLRQEWNNNEDMKSLSSYSHKKVSWKCKSKKSCHIWDAVIKHRTLSNSGCPYCSGHRVCACLECPNLYNDYPELREEWNNDVELMKLYSYGSEFSASWKCKVKGHIYNASIYSRTTANTGCPKCKHKTERKLLDYLTSAFEDVSHQVRFPWIGLRSFDFMLSEYRILIELDGRQHFKQIMNWMSPELTTANDIDKMELACKNNYSIIRLLQVDVYENRNNWKIKLQQAIDDVRRTSTQVVLIGSKYAEMFNKLDHLDVTLVV